MSTKHSDFALLQRRLRRLDPSWYPSSVAIDDEYGPAMAKGIDAALDELERIRGIPALTVAPPTATLASSPPSGLHPKFSFLRRTPLPPLMVRIALADLGTLEAPGTADNPKILGWADEVAEAMPTPYNRWAKDFYNDDAIPHCGLGMAAWATRAAQGRPERMPPDKYLSALAWLNWGVPVPIGEAAVGDVMVLGRKGGGHVTLNVGTEKGEKRFFGLGSNQSDAVTIAPFGVERVRGVRRPPYRSLPAGARRVILSAGGVSSVDEA